MCIFCSIASGQIDAKKIYEDDAVLAFMDLHPVSYGHALVIPKAHATDFCEMDDVTTGKVFSVARKIGCAALEGLKAAGFNIGVNTKPAAGQVVMHAHVHVIPRFENDGLVHWPKDAAAAEKLDQAAADYAAVL